jgi:hypothetical protein
MSPAAMRSPASVRSRLVGAVELHATEVSVCWISGCLITPSPPWHGGCSTCHHDPKEKVHVDQMPRYLHDHLANNDQSGRRGLTELRQVRGRCQAGGQPDRPWRSALRHHRGRQRVHARAGRDMRCLQADLVRTGRVVASDSEDRASGSDARLRPSGAVRWVQPGARVSTPGFCSIAGDRVTSPRAWHRYC